MNKQTEIHTDTKKYASATLVPLFVYLDKYRKLLWGTGWLFTLGYSDFFQKFAEMTVDYDPFTSAVILVLVLFLSWFTWPFILGSALKGSS